MVYFKIGNTDFSMYTNELKINNAVNYSAQTNAAGNTVVDYINSKREIEVGIIPLNDNVMKTLLDAISAFNVSISYRDARRNAIETINCIIPDSNIEYYTIQQGKVLYKAFTLKFIEL